MFNPTITVERAMARYYLGISEKILRESLGDGLPLVDVLRLTVIDESVRIRIFANAADNEMVRQFAIDCSTRTDGVSTDAAIADWENLLVLAKSVDGNASAWTATLMALNAVWLAPELAAERQWQIDHAIEMCEQWEGE